ncbi:MAG: hypothetical protein R3A12_16970 [Ignavibacteria bacterium]
MKYALKKGCAFGDNAENFILIFSILCDDQISTVLSFSFTIATPVLIASVPSDFSSLKKTIAASTSSSRCYALPWISPDSFQRQFY